MFGRSRRRFWKDLFTPRTKIKVSYYWESEFCPRDGQLLKTACAAPDCEALLMSPLDQHCRRCGTQYPWIAGVRRSAAGAGLDWEQLVRDQDPLATFGHTQIWALDYDLSLIGVQAVVSSDDTYGRMRGDSATALKRAGGEEIEADSMQTGVHPAGTAWHTKPGFLKVKYVIHTATLTDSSTETIGAVVAAATTACLEEAEQLGVPSVAFPALNAGRQDLTVGGVARVMIAAARAYFARNTQSCIVGVLFVLYGTDQYAEFISGAINALDTSNPSVSGQSDGT
jgi:O-acetyl-ADP-ribose deacetylase (regulator of RNase III)